LVLENGVYALPDPFIYLLTAMAIWLAAEGLVHTSRQHWCLWSVAAGLLAVLFKYPALPALGPGGVAALLILRRDRRRGLRFLAVQAGMVLAVGLWLIWGYGLNLNDLPREGAEIRESGIQKALDMSRLAHNLYYTFVPLRADATLLILAAGTAAYVAAIGRRMPRIRAGVVWLALPVILGGPWVTSSYSVVTPIDIRYVLPATTAACLLLGAAVGQIAAVIPSRQAAIGRALLAALLFALVFIPQAVESWHLVQEREPPDRRVALRQWVDVNLEPGTILVTQDNHKTFNPFYGGIPYRRWTDWWMMDSFMERSPEEWRAEHGISYAVIPLSQWKQMQESEQGRDYLARMLHLRDFVTPGERGPQMVVYRLWRMEVETQIHFGDSITLTGYDRSADQAAPGGSLTFRFYWQAASTPIDNYSLFIHITPPDDETPLAQADGSPAVPERPTLTWDDPDEMLISPPFAVTLPADLQPGEYRVLIGLYNYTTGRRLPVTDADGNAVGDAWELMRVMVRAG